jgi:hypothetical protein
LERKILIFQITKNKIKTKQTRKDFLSMSTKMIMEKQDFLVGGGERLGCRHLTELLSVLAWNACNKI